MLHSRRKQGIGSHSTQPEDRNSRDRNAQAVRGTASLLSQWTRLRVLVFCFAMFVFVCVIGRFSITDLVVTIQQPHKAVASLLTPYEARMMYTHHIADSDKDTFLLKEPELIEEFQQLSRSASSAPVPEICLLHVGKTAGSTLRCALGFLQVYSNCPTTPGVSQNATKSYHYPTGNLLPILTTHLVHNNHHDCWTEDGKKNNNSTASPLYLITTRNPLHRILSWFTYEFPPDPTEYAIFYKRKLEFYQGCPFETINDLAEWGLATDRERATVGKKSSQGARTTVSESCRSRAYKAIKGDVAYSRHNYYNYAWYRKQMVDPENSALFVLRAEHIAEDWNAIEKALWEQQQESSQTATYFSKPGFVTSESFPRANQAPPSHTKKVLEPSSPKYLSPTARENLCRVLCDEIILYKEMLKRALNLDESQYRISVAELAEECPLQARASNCP